MIFIINGRVKFNEYEGTLEDVDAPQQVQPLVATTCRLLSIFVRNNGMLVKRQQLLEEVWEERGLKGTNSNLNNYISLLRRHLSLFGEDELIITYPRQGFKFVAKKVTRHVMTEMDMLQDTLQNTAQLEQSDHHAAKRGRGSGDKLSYWLRYCSRKNVLTFFSLLSATLLILINVPSLGRENTLSHAQLDSCRIYNMGLHEDNLAEVVQPYVNCQRKTSVYYYNKVIPDNRRQTEKMLVSCRENSGQESCEVIYIP
ncbi:TPA: CadC family transcriptional regulator [Serratia marcescens]|nr:CadC family transcriptional regulator [Serratia marcescens]